MTPERILELCRATIKTAHHCFMITQGEGGETHARLMQPFDPEEDLTIWFGASKSSRKVKEILLDNRVTLAFFDPHESAYVTLIGTGHLVADPAKKAAYWVSSWSEFFKGGHESEDYILVQFVPSRVEVMNFSQNITPEPYGLAPAVLVRKNGGWELVEEEH